MKQKESPCLTCWGFTHAKFKNTEIMRCSTLEKDLSSLSEQCNRFEKRDGPSLPDMREMAWILTKSNKAGYIKPDFELKKNKEGEDESDSVLPAHR